MQVAAAARIADCTHGVMAFKADRDRALLLRATMSNSNRREFQPLHGGQNNEGWTLMPPPSITKNQS